MAAVNISGASVTIYTDPRKFGSFFFLTRFHINIDNGKV